MRYACRKCWDRWTERGVSYPELDTGTYSGPGWSPEYTTHGCMSVFGRWCRMLIGGFDNDNDIAYSGGLIAISLTKPYFCGESEPTLLLQAVVGLSPDCYTAIQIILGCFIYAQSLRQRPKRNEQCGLPDMRLRGDILLSFRAVSTRLCRERGRVDLPALEDKVSSRMCSH